MATVLSPADVDRIAALARLELTDEERARFATQLTAILAYADQVQQADTSLVAQPLSVAQPLLGAQPLAATQTTATTAPRLRDDDLQPSLDRDEVLAQAPAADRAAGLFKVPRVLGS